MLSKQIESARQTMASRDEESTLQVVLQAAARRQRLEEGQEEEEDTDQESLEPSRRGLYALSNAENAEEQASEDDGDDQVSRCSSATSTIDSSDDMIAVTPPPTTRSLVSDLHSHLHDEEISDVVLVGTDDKQVPAVKSILAMRSQFFKSLLFGNFKESNESQVDLGYSSLVLRAVVEYCYTDEIKSSFESLSFEDTARAMVGLVAAGNYFELGGLRAQAWRLTCLMMDEYPALACAVLDESVHCDDGSHTEELSRVALGIIRLRSESALLPPDTYGLGVQSLGAKAMERVMSDDKIQANELSLFLCLKKWAGANPDRREIATKLSSNIDFCKIAPSDLATVVAESNLVPLELMCAAYRTQALQAEREGIAFGQMRSVGDAAGNGSVLVQGALLNAVNGTYAYTSTTYYYQQQTQYIKPGSLSGFGRGKFLLHTMTSTLLADDLCAKKWMLSFRLKGGAMLDLYSSPADEPTPPMQKWLPVPETHEKLRRMISSNKKKKRGTARSKNHQHTSFSPSSGRGGILEPEHLGGATDTPICIWLPNERNQRRSATDGGTGT